mmetsp:Transcript_67002/g.157201  ORF Transcript_67002/g.157201 Transcript_67002/m.157201 type:complete len:591 (+) Transcript_67002:48-1820(+)
MAFFMNWLLRAWHLLLAIAGGTGDLVITAEGPVRGRCSTSTCEYLGIPYAAAPVGTLRWTPPQPSAPWIEERQAQKFGENCMQVKGQRIIGSESCLFLNVWTAKQCRKCTVMFWIHGGSYVTGGTQDMFNGTSLVDFAGELIVVTVNYRLGILGFAGSEQLRSRDPKGSTGNYGLQDQRAALRWVHRNIAAFGGDPQKVVLFGESAGAGSIAVHLTSPESWPLFHSAIMESGAFSYWNAQPMEDAERQFSELISATGCGNASVTSPVACLEDMEGDELTGLATVELNPEPLPEGWKAYGTFFSPTVDGVQLTALPWQLLSSGAFYRDAHVMLGFNKDEGTVLASCEGTPKCELLHKGSNMTKADFELLLTTDMFNISSDKIDDVLAVYADASNTSSTDWYWTATKVYGDYAIACPSLRAAHQIAKMSSKETFLYEFCQTPRAHAPSWAGIFGQAGTVGASHAAELGFVWLGGDGWQASQGASEGGWPLSDKEEWLLAKTIAAYWTNFAKTGNPNRPKGVRTSMTIPWTSLSADEKLKAMQLKLPGLSMKEGLLERRCELIDSFGPMVEGYTMDRRLHEDSPISQAVPVLV